MILLSAGYPRHGFSGYWGVDTLENDSAIGFLDEIVHANEVNGVVGALDAVLNGDQYIDDEKAARALAAAELVAAMIGRPSKTMAKDKIEWAMEQRLRASDMVPLAIRAIDKITQRSETRDLLMESTDSKMLREWEKNVRRLRSRLANK